jgi:hypothetical protein
MSKGKQQFTADQPRDGDVLLGCAHVEGGSGPFEFFKLEDCEVLTPDGRRLEPQWIVACKRCLLIHGAPHKAVCRDYTWRGDDPVIKAPPCN